MAFVVFNKNTQRYLNAHSGSLNRYSQRVKYKLLGYGSCPHRHGSDDYRLYWLEHNKVIEDLCFQSSIDNCRMYKTRGAVITSFYSRCDKVDGKRVMPHHLVIQEITMKVTIVSEG